MGPQIIFLRQEKRKATGKPSWPSQNKESLGVGEGTEVSTTSTISARKWKAKAFKSEN